MLLAALVASGLLLAIRWAAAFRRARTADPSPTAMELAIGFGTNFFDTLGIGSFATTTAIYRLFRLVPDELIPGTLVVGHALPVIVQALFFVSAVAVDPWQMTLLIATCVAGGWLGAGIVATLSRRAVQRGMGCALLAAAVFMTLGMFGWFPAGGTALALSKPAFALALAVNFVLGALITLGIGNYAPSLVLFSLLGMDPRAAFPIMMGSGAFVATIAGVRFISAARFHGRAALGLAVGGIPGVIGAAWLVQSMPLEMLRWLVLAVICYAAATLLRAGFRPAPSSSQEVPSAGAR
jgi:uncharacterized membrane protein YfcA